MELKIEVDPVGAELTSAKLDGVEKIHQGNKIISKEGEVYWKRHAPILFPIVGRLKNEKTIIQGKEYEMSQHGFARDMEFALLEKNDEKQVYRLSSTKETLKRYPFAFELYVTYTTLENQLDVHYRVVNKDKKEMVFGIGGHPAFICDIPTDQYYIEFEKVENAPEILHLERGLVGVSNSYINKDILVDGKYIYLNSHTFDRDAIILNQLESHTVFLKHKEKEEEVLSFFYEGFHTLAFWSKKEAPFLCIEPWNSTADTVDSEGQFLSKNGIIHLEKEKEFMCHYTVTFH